jgi:hypothetical protein
MTDSDERKHEDSNGTNRQLAEGEIIEFFEKLELGSAADRERFLSLERLIKNLDCEQEKPEEFRVVFGDSTARDPTSE